MGTTTLADVNNQIQKFWSPIFMDELREKLLLGAIVNKDYEGEIRKKGDTVRVSQIVAPQGELKTVGVDADSFSTEPLETKYIDIKADKRAVAAFEFEDLVDIQSQIESDSSEIRDALLYAAQKKVNDYLYTFLKTPDLTSVTDFNASQLVAARIYAGQKKWMKNKAWWALVDPVYNGDLLTAQTLTSQDYVGDKPTVGGQIATPRFGFNIVEDDSRPADKALMCHPDFLHLVMQTMPRFKVSDQHSNKKFGHIISVDFVLGAKEGIDHADLHYVVEN